MNRLYDNWMKAIPMMIYGFGYLVPKMRTEKALSK